jgi:hypothetical protein
MYGFSSDLNLAAVVGQEITQFCVGPYDLQFSFGKVRFAVQSQMELKRDGSLIAAWQGGEWPGAGFYEAFCVPAVSAHLMDERRLCITLENGLELHILDNSEQYESLLIFMPDEPGPRVV